jgi:Flp pilus assembly secretin CpaC
MAHREWDVMRKLNKFLLVAASALMTLQFCFATAQAAEAIAVETDQTLMVSIPAVPGAVVIGNPTIADVSMQGTKMFILGRNFGTTNIYILDNDGNPMATFDVSVKHVTNNAVAVFKGTARQSYDCAPLCETTIQVGDEAVHNKVVSDQVKTKIELATGADTAKSEAPPAPQ